MSAPSGSKKVISVVFEDRVDGGLRVYSDDVPGFHLSHPNKELVLKDVRPALETILSEKEGYRVRVSPVDESTALPWGESRKRQRFSLVRAA